MKIKTGGINTLYAKFRRVQIIVTILDDRGFLLTVSREKGDDWK